MKKFFLGLALGLAVGFFGFKYQVKKVDYFSYRVGYTVGRISQVESDLGPDDVYRIGCAAYHKMNLDKPPYGYESTGRDVQLKILCQEQ